MVVVEPTQGPHTRNPYVGVGVGWGRGEEEEEKISKVSLSTKLFFLVSICLCSAEFDVSSGPTLQNAKPHPTRRSIPFIPPWCYIHLSDVLLENGDSCLN